MATDPLQNSKTDLAEIIDRISHPDSPVGIDAQFTHAVIIGYLQQISTRLEAIEDRLESLDGTQL